MLACGGDSVSHTKSDGGSTDAQATRAANAPLHFAPGFTSASQLVTQLGSAHESADFHLQTVAHAWVRSGRPPAGPSYQQLVSAESSVEHTPALADAAPDTHEKLDAGCFARQSVAAVEVGVHQVTSFFEYSHERTHAVVAAAPASEQPSVASVAQSVVQSSLTAPELVAPVEPAELVEPEPTDVASLDPRPPPAAEHATAASMNPAAPSAAASVPHRGLPAPSVFMPRR